MAAALENEGRRPRPYLLNHTLDWTQITFEKEDPLVVFAYLTLVIGYMEDEYDKVTSRCQEEGPAEFLTERFTIEVEDEDTKENIVHLDFKVELFVKAEDGGQSVLLFFLAEGDSYDLKSFLDRFKERISHSFKKIEQKKLPDKV